METRKLLAAAGLGAFLLCPAVAIHMASASAIGVAPLTIVQDGASVDPNHSLVGVQFDSQSGAATASGSPALIPASSALDEAKAATGLLTNSATRATAFFTLFTDTMYATRDSTGQMQPQFVKVPAWVITFTGISRASDGPPPIGANTSAASVQYSQELHVAINAVTGKYMEEYSYR